METRSNKGIASHSGLGGATHAILRIGAGLLFFVHGAPKQFGWFGGVPANVDRRLGLMKAVAR